jgi:outer membrane protein TolC
MKTWNTTLLSLELLTAVAFSVSVSAAEPWTLESALDYALGHNPDARIAQQRLAAAQAGLEQANSAFWPKLQVQSGYTRTDNPMLAFGSILNQRSYSSSLNFNVSVTRSTTTEGCINQGKLAAWTRMRVYPC